MTRKKVEAGIIRQTLESPLDFKTQDSDAPAANTDAEITYAAEQGRRHRISGVAWSYDADPTGGNLRIHDNDNHDFLNIDITVGGPAFIPFEPRKQQATGQPLVITLAAGGAGISGKINVMGHETIG